jgi:Myb-like DNA-binding domain
MNSETIQWSDIAKRLFLKNDEIIFRPGKHCRERWNNYLDPNLKK